MQRLAKIVGSKDDVALLSVTPPFGSDLCALRVTDTDVFATKGVRFGIPGGLQDPQSVKVKIGEKESEFSPLVVLSPAITEAGESGGPVIYLYRVVGITRAKHEEYRI